MCDEAAWLHRFSEEISTNMPYTQVDRGGKRTWQRDRGVLECFGTGLSEWLMPVFL